MEFNLNTILVLVLLVNHLLNTQLGFMVPSIPQQMKDKIMLPTKTVALPKLFAGSGRRPRGDLFITQENYHITTV